VITLYRICDSQLLLSPLELSAKAESYLSISTRSFAFFLKVVTPPLKFTIL
jgi:hypothetical protein